MTPSSALTALIARLNADSNLVECKSPNGLMDGGSMRLNRGFAVKPKALKPLKGRNRSDVAGMRVSQTFEVTLGHVLKPSSGITAPSQAMTDLHSALKYLFVPNTTLTSGSGAAIYIGGVTVKYEEGGAYMTQTFGVELHYNLDLTSP